MIKKRFKWWAKFPSSAYANDFDFRKPVTEAEARKHIRSWSGRKTLHGVEVWSGDY